MASHMSFLYQNVRGLNTKLTNLFVDSFDFNFDVIVLTETWLKPGILNNEILCDKFNIFRRDRLNAEGGGVFIAVSQNLFALEVLTPYVSFIEFICVKISLPDSSLYVTCSYIPPGSKIDVYNDHCRSLSFVCSLLSDCDKILVTGDFNLPLITWTRDCDSSKFLEPSSTSVPSLSVINSFISLGLFQLNYFKNSNSRILDLIFVDKPDNYLISRTDPVTLPEDLHHPPLEITFSLDKPSDKQPDKELDPVFNFNKTNVNQLRTLLSNTNWSQLLPIECNVNVNEMVNCFNQVLYNYFDVTIPKEAPPNFDGPVWYTDYLRSFRNKKTRLYRKYKKYKNTVDYTAYLSMRYQYSVLCKAAYQHYISKLLGSIKTRPKNFWKFVNLKRKSGGLPCSMQYENRVSDDRLVISNMFADYFSSNYSNDAYTDDSYPYNIDHFDISDPIIDEEIVNKCLRSLKPSYFPGPDNIPAFILKTFCDTLTSPLTLLFNLSFQSGCFPNAWKTSYILPLHKSGNKTDITNYRGITKLSAIPII